MTTSNEDEIQIIDDVALDPEGERAKPAKAREDSELSPEVVDSLKQQLATLAAERDEARLARQQETERREKAESDARTLADTAVTAKRSAEYANYQLVETSISQAKTREAAIKRELRSAHEVGDYERIADLQAEQAKVAARLLQYEDNKSDIEARERQRIAQAKAEPERKPEIKPVQYADPFEAQISGLTEPTKQWLRTHKECVTDEVRSKEAIAADAHARRAGLKADTPEYFKHIEERLRYSQPTRKAEPEADETDEVIVSDPKPVARQMAAAPVSRDSTPGNKPTGPIRLSRAEVEMAEALGMTPKQYWANKVAVEKQGLYNN